MSPEKLTYMANQIATFFQSQPQETVRNDFADHINKFWEPRMRAQLLQLIAEGQSSLKPLVIEAEGLIRKSGGEEPV